MENLNRFLKWQEKPTNEPGRSARIVSPPFACGVTWLINALLHLNVKVTNPNFGSEHWHQKGKDWYISKSAADHLKWHLPTLHDRNSFVFQDPIEIFWEHRLDFARDAPCPTVLFVRDPRDAIYSLYRRDYADHQTFLGHLNRPNIWPDHFPELFHLPPLETFAYFSWFWLAMGNFMPLKVVRFEEVKAHPVRVIREILQFLGLERSNIQIKEAIESSGIEKAEKAMRTMEEFTGRKFRTVRKGQVGEWQSSYSARALRCVRGIGTAIINDLRYGVGTGLDFQIQSACGDEWPGREFEDLIRRQFSSSAEGSVIRWIRSSGDGNHLDSSEIFNGIHKLDISGPELLKIGSIFQAIFAAQKIFGEVSSPRARCTISLFVYLNISYMSDWPIQVLAWRGLLRIQEATGKQVLKRLGVRYENRLEKLSRISEVL